MRNRRWQGRETREGDKWRLRKCGGEERRKGSDAEGSKDKEEERVTRTTEKLERMWKKEKRKGGGKKSGKEKEPEKVEKTKEKERVR